MEIIGTAASKESDPGLSPSALMFHDLGHPTLQLGQVLAPDILRELPPHTFLHGTPVPPNIMGDKVYPYEPRNFIDGQWARDGGVGISASPRHEFPVARSLLHDQHPALEGRRLGFVLMCPCNQPYAYIMTSLTTLETLIEQEAEGFIYGIHVPPDSARPYESSKFIEEVRIPEPTGWQWVARTTLDDLPDDIMVADIIEGRGLVKFLGAMHHGGDPVCVGEELGVKISTLGAMR
jgi:hypothetical protein